MMTEDEAKTKWCPLLRMIPSTGDHHALSMRGEVMVKEQTCSSTCIGSECMAWRWIGHNQDDPERHGYCGSFGRPV